MTNAELQLLSFVITQGVLKVKKVLWSLSAAILLSGLASAEAWANPQHERMRRCSQEAKEKTLKGDERKQFMSGCLKGKHPPGAATAATAVGDKAKGSVVKSQPTAVADASASAPEQKARAKECNQAATEKTLKGAERKSFISACMKG